MGLQDWGQIPGSKPQVFSLANVKGRPELMGLAPRLDSLGLALGAAPRDL
jgi:hypothetical protein